MTYLADLQKARRAEFRAIMAKAHWQIKFKHLHRVCNRLNGRQKKTYRKLSGFNGGYNG